MWVLLFVCVCLCFVCLCVSLFCLFVCFIVLFVCVFLCLLFLFVSCSFVSLFVSKWLALVQCLLSQSKRGKNSFSNLRYLTPSIIMYRTCMLWCVHIWSLFVALILHLVVLMKTIGGLVVLYFVLYKTIVWNWPKGTKFERRQHVMATVFNL
jgi:hypothetical protein